MPEKNLEFITINGNEETKYEAYINSTYGYMDITIEGSYEELRNVFSKVSSIKLYPDNNEGTTSYGIYPNVEFVTSAQGESENTVIIRIHILTDEEVRMRELESMVNDHESILSEMMFG